MIQQMGPLCFLSCRTSERNIKAHSNAIKSGSRAGRNASNNLVKQSVLRSSGIQDVLDEDDRSYHYGPETFLYNPNGDQGAPQLWDPASVPAELGSTTLCGGLDDQMVINSLQSYYARLGHTNLSLEDKTILVAKRLWLDSSVISSVLYRKKMHLKTRADNFVLFESYRNRR